MTSPLDGCHAKLRRAYQHLRSLDDAIQDWGKQTPYAPAVRIDAKSGEHVVTIAQVLEPPMLGWAVITGDALHNLRSALDHLVCVLARTHQPAHECRGMAFPVLRHESKWDKDGLKRLGPIDDPWTVLTLRGLQPFVRWRDDGKGEPLWVLNELINTDKHRTLNLGTLFLYQPELTVDPPGSAEVTWVRSAGPFEDGDEMARYRKIDSRAKVHHRYGVDIVFKDPGPAEGTKVDVMLGWLFDTVVYVIDLFDYKFFDGPPPAGTKRAVISASGTETSDVEGAHSNSPEAKRERWGTDAPT
jgi:hypothetical protein